MQNRAVAWRQKAPANHAALVEEALQLKLFLVQEKGPTSLTFSDEEGNKFKLSIGYEVTCSCQPQLRDQCVHTLFALLKKFRVDKKSPILYQASYLDSEILDILAGKFQERKSSNSGSHARRAGEYLHAHSKLNNIQKNLNKETGEYFRKPLDPDSMCSICQENLSQEDILTYCRRKCGNNFHVKCLRIWVEHRAKIGEKTTCPMCRADMGTRVLDDLRKDEADFLLRHETHVGRKCIGCNKKPIVGHIYHCLQCTNTALCLLCFERQVHSEHNKFLWKTKAADQWRVVLREVTRRANGLELSVRHLALTTPHLAHLTADSNYHFQETNNSLALLSEALLQCLPTTQENAPTTLGFAAAQALSIVGYDVYKQKNVCAKCGSAGDRTNPIRFAHCGHAFDAHCLAEQLAQEELACLVCKQPILQGLYSALGKKKPVNALLADTSKSTQDENSLNSQRKSLQGTQQNTFQLGITGKKHQTENGPLRSQSRDSSQTQQKRVSDSQNQGTPILLLPQIGAPPKQSSAYLNIIAPLSNKEKSSASSFALKKAREAMNIVAAARNSNNNNKPPKSQQIRENLRLINEQKRAAQQLGIVGLVAGFNSRALPDKSHDNQSELFRQQQTNHNLQLQNYSPQHQEQLLVEGMSHYYSESGADDVQYF